MKTTLRILNLEDNEADAELNQAMISKRSLTSTAPPKKCSAANAAIFWARKISQLLVVLDQAGADDTAPFECALTRANGSALPVRVHTTRLTLHGHPLVLRPCRDLSGH